MSGTKTSNENWARRMAARWLPGEQFRWESYSVRLTESLNSELPWLDLGCGPSDFIVEHMNKANPAIGVDIQAHRPPPGLFTIAKLESLPFADGSTGTLSLRFVLEHIENPQDLWTECRRVLAPGGKLVLITTNRRNPLVWLAGLLPAKLKERIISRVFSVNDEQIFPTFHHWNTPAKLSDPPDGFQLDRIDYIQATDWHNKAVFLIQLFLASFTRPRVLRRVRDNILAVYIRAEDR